MPGGWAEARPPAAEAASMLRRGGVSTLSGWGGEPERVAVFARNSRLRGGEGILAPAMAALSAHRFHDAPAAAARGATLHALRAHVARATEARGERLGATEIVGLVPERLLAAGGDPAALEIRGGWTSASLERRLRGASEIGRAHV